MTLEERYNAASADTNAGKARITQAADVGAKPGVNFMDAGARSGTVDTMQSNFERRVSGETTFTQSAETTTYGQTERKGLSRWFGRALNYAFTDPKAPGNYIQDSVWKTFKTLRAGTKDKWADNPTHFHRWTPSAKFNVSLTGLSKSRATPKSAPST